jgi:DNA-binding HxlR family transcriptional regulator
VRAGADGVHRLTELGEGLRPALEPLREWSEPWSDALTADEPG